MNNINTLNHVAVILDGNRRYAKERNLPAFKGHEEGAQRLEDFLKWCKELGIKEATFYCLSTENLKRDADELNHLFRIFRLFFNKIKKNMEKEKIKIRFIGDLSLVPEDIRKLAHELETESKNYEDYQVNFCFAYGGRLELVQAINKLLKSGKKQVSEEDITKSLWLADEPQLIIRTGDAVRTSNFLPWQSVYSEWVFLDKMWPEFSKKDLEACMENFNRRKRNFGK